MRTLLIDNYDSYTFNVYQLLAKINGEVPFVIRNDQIDWLELRQLDDDLSFENIVISPGPGHPANKRDFGICQQVLQQLEKPILGICLGHQGLGYTFGGSIIHAPEVRHGRISQIFHQKTGLFKEIPNPFSAVRYHSLVVNPSNLPNCLDVIAQTNDGLIMGLCHCKKPIFGVQFHPESICTEYGYQLFENFKTITEDYYLSNTVLKKGERETHQTKARLSSIQTIIPSRTKKSFAITPSSSQELEFQVFSRKLDYFSDSEQVFVHLYGESEYSFWLDSSQFEPGLSRFSFMGDNKGKHSLQVKYYQPNQILEVIQNNGNIKFCQKNNIFDYLQTELDQRFCDVDTLPFDFNGGFVGYFGYELKQDCEAKFSHSFSLPNAAFLLATQIIVFDHQEQETYLLYLGQSHDIDQANVWFQEIENRLKTLPPLAKTQPIIQPELLTFRFSRSRQVYLQDITQCLEEIKNGESYEICLTNQLHTQTDVNPLDFYRNLRHRNPAPYAAFLKFGDFSIVCSSPERFLKVERNRWVETKPIKGTLPRGITPFEDSQIREQLGNSEKDRSENLMVLDLLRNDLGLVCEVGSVHVPKLMQVETYATVHQLVSTVRGRLRSDIKVTDCIRETFPGGSMTGAPKLRTMEIIDRLEGEARGIYSGAIGFLGLNGTADLNIVIRTAIATGTDISIGVGGGIVTMSDPELEFEELLLKAKVIIEALVQTVHGSVTPNLYRIEL